MNLNASQKREQRCESVALECLRHPSHILRHCAYLAHGTYIRGNLLRLVSVLGEPCVFPAGFPCIHGMQNHSTALLLIRDCYESIVLTSFFYLLLNYISHDTEEQKEVFRRVRFMARILQPVH